MSVTVKACLLGRYEQVKEIRRFPVDQHVYRSFDNLRRKTAAVFSNLKNSSFSLFYKDEDGDLVAFSSDDELMMGLGYMRDSTFRLFIKEKKEHRRDFALHALLPYIFGHVPPHGPRYLQPQVPSRAPYHSSFDAPTIGPPHITSNTSIDGMTPIPHVGIKCDSCKGKIIGECYKCSECTDVNLCSTCKDEGKHSHNVLSHPQPPDPIRSTSESPGSNDPLDALTPNLHDGIKCDGCQGQIIGMRYKCSDCKDFDLCSTCNDEGKHNHHTLLPISKPLSEFTGVHR
ncbi:sequestosome-1 isoform X2 [Oryzias melastigma]|uniref:sequestosome-1 isoform X2 n=1 Tax=Oryzias melastigma TaxID=30732 RepID=UPI000CF7DFFA|nr:sequestosome-1 isoform X2 [Oryzias melastigma]